MWKDEATAADILLAAQDIQRFTERMSYSDFMQNDLVQAAVVQRIMLMGEAAKGLSPEFRADHSEIEWPQIAGTRDRCVHGYDTIKVEIVWRLLQWMLRRLSAISRQLSAPRRIGRNLKLLAGVETHPSRLRLPKAELPLQCPGFDSG
jgi:uncharacterized protein with HEPN domain